MVLISNENILLALNNEGRKELLGSRFILIIKGYYIYYYLLNKLKNNFKEFLFSIFKN